MIETLIRMVRALSKREQTILGICVVALIVSGFYSALYLVRANTTVVAADGGSYTEGIVGQVSLVNPILAQDGSPDQDLVTLLFANTITLAESVKHSNDFRTWNVRIKEGATWSDGQPITSDDFVFTVQTIQNPDALSPLYADWSHISISRVSEREVVFQLSQPYAPFENMLEQLRPIPQHIFASIAPANIRLSKYNLEPVGSGPFVFSSSQVQDTGFISSYNLHKNDAYEALGPLPHLSTIALEFFEQEQDMIDAFNKGLLDGICTTNPLLAQRITIRTTQQDIPSLKYYAVFLNQSANPALKYIEVREALDAAIDRNELIQNIFNNKADQMEGPLPPALHISEQSQTASTSPETLLQQGGWVQNQVTGNWEKTIGKNQTISLTGTLSIPDSEPVKTIAQDLINQWQKHGIHISLDSKDPASFTDEIIKTRNYQMLLFGNILLTHPDLLHFWGSSERFYPGLNFSLYSNASVDTLMGTLKRVAVDDPKRSQILETITRYINQDMPALFLVSPHYIYITKPSVQGMSTGPISLPAERFNDAAQWYVKTKRVLK